MTPEQALGLGKDTAPAAALSELSLPHSPNLANGHLRIQLPARALEPIASFIVAEQQSELLGTDRYVDLPQTWITSRKGKEAIRGIMFETVLSDLSAFARLGTVPEGSKDRLAILAGIILAVANTGESEIRAATAQAVSAAKDSIAQRIKAASKLLKRLDSRGDITVKDATSMIQRAISAVCELRALHWLTPASLSHSMFCDLGTPALNTLVEKLQNGINHALDRADFNLVDPFISLQEEVLSLLHNGRLDKAAPAHLSASPKVIKGVAAGHPPTLPMLRLGIPGVGSYEALAPEVRCNLPKQIMQTRCAVAALKEHKSWTTEDKSPTHELLESLIDALPAAANDIAALDPAQTAEFPAGIAAYISLLSRLRYHGDSEGLLSFIIALGPREDHGNLKHQISYYAQQCAPVWLRLVKAAASWPQLSPGGRQALWAEDGLEIKHTIARGLWMVCSMFATRVPVLLKEQQLTTSSGIVGLAQDSEALRAGAEVLALHLEPHPIAALMRQLSTEVCPSLIRAFKAMELAEDTTLTLLKKAQQLPTSFGDNPLERELETFCNFVRQAAAETAESEAYAALDALSGSFDNGDVGTFVLELDRFLTLAAATPEGSLVRTEHLRSADELTRSYVNLITEGFASEIAVAARQDAKIESLRTQLSHFADLRDVISTRSSMLGPVRTNHLADQVISALNANCDVSVALLNELSYELSVARSESTLKLVRLIAAIPGCLRRVSARAPAVVDDFRKLAEPLP